jgi:hypothetical protein
VEGNDAHGGNGYIREGDTAVFQGEPLDGRVQTIVFQVAI